jgi:lysine 2,3-aminomutase
MLRVRLGTRLPVYLPQRITDELIEILSEFKEKASAIGIKQFVIQSHFESAMEVTPEAKEGIQKLISAGWIVTNQQVFTAAASRRGHTAKLRKVLNEIGVLPYYTFSVKGFMENYHNFATNARSMQEQFEEKRYGLVSQGNYEKIRKFPEDSPNMVQNIRKLLEEEDMPFLGTDRNYQGRAKNTEV